MSTKTGSWIDDPCYYLDATDEPPPKHTKFILLSGPFKTKEEAEKHIDKCIELAKNIDPWAHLYYYGTCRMKNGYREGKFNKELGI